ncbi:MAG: peptidoglycan DD-metalloendopeptidase family protein, partial [Anaerolineales bacterium]|nr:peptidoglycan DD-metalloendopeptidase family protein [Anaerolineales bacterium]
LVVFIVGITILLGWDTYMNGWVRFGSNQDTPIATVILPTQTPAPRVDLLVDLPAYKVDPALGTASLNRVAVLDTEIPVRARVDVMTYTVQLGDSIFSIADDFGLKAETVLWGNFELLEDNPHLLKTGQKLNILPVNGTYYQWNENDRLTQVAGFFKVDPQKIIEYPGNRLDLTETNLDDPGLEVGQWLIVPDGWRPIKDWGPPAITRSNPASAAYYGAGHCGSIYEGAIGIGTFVWPTNSHQVSGYHYDPGVHPAIDIGGSTGNSIYATDNGVIVYAGWSNYGYGYLIVVDHGTGWQSAYAHLSAVGVSCGQSVFQGTVIGAMGSTGNSSGPHLHFELVYNGAKVNPLNYMQ